MIPNRDDITEEQKESVCLEVLQNALTAAFLACCEQHFTMGEVVHNLELVLSVFLSGPKPPFRTGAITTISLPTNLQVMVFTHRKQCHNIIIHTLDRNNIMDIEPLGDPG